jgi:tRNA-uridine 2-sulfurtransferase
MQGWLLMGRQTDIKLTCTNDAPRGSGEPVALLMSGGVDSSTSAHILREMGCSVIGITMQVRRAEDGKPAKAVQDASRVCQLLGVPHYFADLSQPFEDEVVGKFRESYAAGQTPNPCVDCNMRIKFGLLWELAKRQLGIAKVATGHYARIIREGGECRLARAVDKTKDQSYFLSGIPRLKLADIIFPLGERTKVEVRKAAAEIGLHVADKAESMELCFAGEGDYRAMLGLEHASNEGDLLDMRGSRIGTHKGIANYTIGQRRGIGFAGGKPLYVGGIDPVRNTVMLGTREEVCRHSVTAKSVNALIPEELAEGREVIGKIRSYGEGRACTLSRVESDSLTVRFAEGEFAPCPGQRLVVYNDRECVIAGGTITHSVE